MSEEFKELVRRILAACEGKRFTRTSEMAFHDQLEWCLVKAGFDYAKMVKFDDTEQWNARIIERSPDKPATWRFSRERRLGAEDRLDFFCSDAPPDYFVGGAPGFAIEVKLEGGLEKHLRQIKRYARSDIVLGVVLIAMRPHEMPETLNGKPVVCLNFAPKCL